MASINGQPNRVPPSSSRLFAKKRDKKQKKKKERELFQVQVDEQLQDIDGIGRLAADNYFSADYFASDFVARLETMYGMVTDGEKKDSSILENPKRIKINADDWSELAEDGICLSDCCGEECDEVSV